MIRPRMIVFFGGDTANADLSEASGKWVCQYIPRNQLDVTPVMITPDQQWKVPVGTLPRSGSTESIARTIDMLAQVTPAVSAREGLQKLADHHPRFLMTTLRGAGGDDGSLHHIGSLLGANVVGPSLQTCNITSNKQICQSMTRSALTPQSMFFPANTSLDDIANKIRDNFLPPLFIKPARAEGSAGITRIESFDELLPVVNFVKQFGDFIIQAHVSGQEYAVTLTKDTQGKHIILPPSQITTKRSAFYDHMAKRRTGRVQIDSVTDSQAITQAQTIAQDVYDELNCDGPVTIDVIQDGTKTYVLDVNTVPTFSEQTPLVHQLRAGNHNPTQWLTRALEF